MFNLLPAVLVGGPSNAGKSVLFYQLTQALRERGVPHHAIRACPDGEGNWYHEGDPTVVKPIRDEMKLKEWPPAFVERVCRDLEHRCLPFLIDMGGHPKPSQICLFRLCTHSILLLKADRPADTAQWDHLVAEGNLLPLARVTSEQQGTSVITSLSPILEGTLTGLNRHAADAGKGALLETLVERMAALFNSYDLRDQKKIYLEQADTELVLDLEEALQTFTTTSKRWETAMLQPFLESLPTQTPLSVYGAGPSWLYAALAAYEDPQPFYLFDPRLRHGWVQPAPVMLGEPQSPEIVIKLQNSEEVTVLTMIFPNDRLEHYLDSCRPDPYVFPRVSAEKGLIINGRVPNWLLTALMRLYKAEGVPWIAPFYAQSNHAVVAYSRLDTYRPGDLVSKPAF